MLLIMGMSIYNVILKNNKNLLSYVLLLIASSLFFISYFLNFFFHSIVMNWIVFGSSILCFISFVLSNDYKTS